jgi:hypothetical protein
VVWFVRQGWAGRDGAWAVKRAEVNVIAASEDRILSWFAADFEPDPRYQSRVPSAAAAMNDVLETKHVAMQQGFWVSRNLERKVLVSVINGRISVQALGSSAFKDPVVARAIHVGLGEVKPNNLKRLGFKTYTLFPLNMVHREMVSLMFGSFLVKEEELCGVVGDVEDLMLKLIGTSNGMKYELNMAPLTKEQASKTARGMPNMELFADDAWVDNPGRDAVRKLTEEGLFVDIDFSQEKVHADGASLFLQNAVAAAGRVSESVVARLIGKSGGESK